MRIRVTFLNLVLILGFSLPIGSANAVSANPSAVCTGLNCTITFSYTGDYYSWTVPASVNSLTIDVRGARGGNGVFPSCTNGSAGSNGGLGGKVTGTLTVTAGSTLYIYVGGKGEDGITQKNSGGFNGGGGAGFYNGGAVSGPCYPGSGGGASDIRTAVADLSSRLVVAGGGGGAGGYTTGSGGAGGGTTAGSGTGSSWPAGNGGGGTSSAGGTKGSVCGSQSAGSLGNGGFGGGCSHGGGGGGGGYYGGGGGAIEPGGGGSSFANATFVSSVVHTQGTQNGDGQIIVSYTATPDTTAPTFTSSSSFSAAENISTSTNAATIKVSESATVTISSGADAARFNIVISDSITAFIRFKVSPDFEAPTDVGGNNVYEITLTATDSASNAGTQSITITVTDVVDTSSFNSFTVSSPVTFRSTATISANVTVASRITFKAANVIISGCKNKLATGSGSNFSVTCTWKPSKRGAVALTALSTPTSAGITGAAAAPINVNVANRSGRR